MREFTFSITYEPGADPLMDEFVERPELAADSMDVPLTPDAFCRVERFTGPRPALDAVERLRTDPPAVESVGETALDATADHHVIERDPGRRVVYSYVGDVVGGTTIQTLAAKHLDRGALVRTRREGDRHEWRLFLRSDRNVGLFYDALTGRLREGLSFRTGHLRDADAWDRIPTERTELPGEQRVALREAFRRGYYETPRRISLEELADELDVPRSTLSYRLRRAEARLVGSYAGSDR
ncbi:helix-turn-helix domain-containing protein [Salinirubellus sp. GCM10025818]|jgi:predicted DNA binding protein|uniref:helix-turn-helix domain-containing protein n=1 Tax=Salinirubellus TaxID=2162630 RepID=UPI0030D2FAED